MPWVRLDEGFATHPKVIEAGPLAIAMHVAGLCYANTHLTDGRIPKPAAATLLDFTGLGMRLWQGELVGGGEDAGWELVVEDLVRAGIWHEPGHDCGDCPAIERGFVIHDYLDYQPSKERVLSEREQKREAGRKGGKASAKARAIPPAQAPASPSATAPAQAARQAESKPVPVPVPVPEPVDAGSSDPVENGKGGVQGGDADFNRTLRTVAEEHADRRIAGGYDVRKREGYVRGLMKSDEVRNEAMKRTRAPANVRGLLDGIGKPIDEAREA